MAMIVKIALKMSLIFVVIGASDSTDQTLSKDTIRQNAKKSQSPFYWQPKLLISMAAPKKVYDINQVVLLRGYKLGITMMALVEGFPERKKHHHLNPLEAEFYTNAYRWFWRHMELVTPWLYGEAGSYYETVKLWNTRFLMADTFMPNWMQKMLIYIPAEDWEAERNEFRSFTKYAAITFAKHLRYPNNNTRSKNWWKSHESKDSADELPPPFDPDEKKNTNTDEKGHGIQYTKRSSNASALDKRNATDMSSGLELNNDFSVSNPSRTDTDNPTHWDAETAFMAMSESKKRFMFEKLLLEAADAVQRDSQKISERDLEKSGNLQSDSQLLSDVGAVERFRDARQLWSEALRSTATARVPTTILIIMFLYHSSNAIWMLAALIIFKWP